MTSIRIDPGCSECEKGYLLGQGYGYADIPEGWIEVQRCDNCRTHDGDEAAARAAAWWEAQSSSLMFKYFPGGHDDDGDDQPGDWAINMGVERVNQVLGLDAPMGFERSTSK
jgi:hypothetical protein